MPSTTFRKLDAIDDQRCAVDISVSCPCGHYTDLDLTMDMGVDDGRKSKFVWVLDSNHIWEIESKGWEFIDGEWLCPHCSEEDEDAKSESVPPPLQ